MAATKTTHVLVFPYPAQGHMPALLDLTNQLALRGLKITILVTPKNLPALNPLLLAHSNSIDTLVLPFPPHPKLPSHVENVKDIGNSGNPFIISSLSKLEGDVINWFKSHPSPPHAIISDFFLGFTQQWATQLNIPRLGFFIVSAFLTSVLNHLWLHFNELDDSDMVEFPDLPRSPSFIKDQLPSIFRKFKAGDSDWEIFKEGLIENSKSWGHIYNSFYDLEGEYLDHIKQELGHKYVYTIGPLPTIERVNPGLETSYGVLKWLDTCPDGSVLYVCFGSQKVLSELLVKALASGLEKSSARFIWVVKSVNSDQVPHGFDERVMDRGVVIKGWAPQVEILNHRAIGGFMSHCGWNSLLESLIAGVMLLGWPMEADQFVNAKLMVEYLGLAVKVAEGEDSVPESDEIARVIDWSIGQDIPQKARVKEMKEKALKAMKPGGTSPTRLDELVQDLRHIQVSRT